MIGHTHRGDRTRNACLLAVFALCAANAPARAESGGFFKDMFSGSGSSPSLMAPKAFDPNDAYCPPVAVSDGAAVLQSFAGAAGDRNRLRHQIVFGQISRECTTNPDGSLTVKVGAILRVLLGPAGAAGRFEAPLTFAIKFNEKTVTARSRRVAVTVPSGSAQGTASAIEDGLIVPADMALGFEIEIGLSGQPARSRPQARAASKRDAKPGAADAAATEGGAQAAGQ